MTLAEIKQSKKYFYLYKITNNINQKFYYGIHCTNNLDDNYMGSGKLLRQAYKKYGISNFTKEIIQYCSSLEEVSKLEQEIVNTELLNNPLCYNLVKGGYYIDEETLQQIGRKNSEYQKGERNSQFGTKWIHNEEKSIKVHLDKVDEYLANGWVIGRFMSDDFKCKMKKVTANRCWVYKGDESHLIYVDDLEKYLSDGYLRGRHEKQLTEKKKRKKENKQQTKRQEYPFFGKVLVYDENYNKILVEKTDPKYLSKEYVICSTGKIPAKDLNGNKLGLIDIDDPRFKTGEAVRSNPYDAMLNKISAKDENGNICVLDKNSKEWLSGKYKGVNAGKHWKQQGENHFVGYKWMNNGLTQTRCAPDQFDKYLSEGYVFGRLPKN